VIVHSSPTGFFNLSWKDIFKALLGFCSRTGRALPNKVAATLADRSPCGAGKNWDTKITVSPETSLALRSFK
ncbi:MAG TPA: hypothetical protein VHA06_12665, partial [Candidatus Angelobacter sp.]|nr:hypothetical protein [Candidatus Angelobacter sp.]